MSTLKTNTLSNVAGTASTAIENAINGSAKAWVNFNGTGTVAIRASYNVTSITDNGSGNYTVNFTTSMPDANYSVAHALSSQGAAYHILVINSATTSSLQVYTCYVSSFIGDRVLQDSPFNSISVFR
jgi:hypothetical protein